MATKFAKRIGETRMVQNYSLSREAVRIAKEEAEKVGTSASSWVENLILSSGKMHNLVDEKQNLR